MSTREIWLSLFRAGPDLRSSFHRRSSAYLLTWKISATIFAIDGGHVKKDYLILILFLAITVISGGMIWMLKSPQPEPAVPMQNTRDDNAALKASIRQLEAGLAAEPENLDLLVKLGNAYYDIDEPRKSIEYYERALGLRPDMPLVLADCGVMYREIDQPDKAIELFRKAIEIDPDLPQAYFNLGAVLRMEKNDPKGAAAAWQKFLELTPNPDPRIKEFLMSEIESALGGQTE
jgi:tetratricopeptide (TPR) repeat protein